jgi:long-chain acyl-CoA synthetase
MSARKGSRADATLAMHVPPGAARALARLARHVEHALDPLGLSLPQYRVLSLLGDGSTASSALAHRLAVSPPSVTAVVDGLVARALVERQADPEDRRRLTLLLTPGGVDLLRAAEAAVDARLGEVAEYLEDPTGAAAAIEALQQWNHALDAFREEKRAAGSVPERRAGSVPERRAGSVPARRSQ